VAEGDTIHRLAGGLNRALGEANLKAFRFSGRRSAKMPEPGERIVEIRARGKHLLMRFEAGSTLHTHLGMSGTWRVSPTEGSRGMDGDGVRAVVQTPDAVAVCRRAPVVELLDDAGLRRHPVLTSLGPDLCDPEPDLDEALLRMGERLVEGSLRQAVPPGGS